MQRGLSATAELLIVKPMTCIYSPFTLMLFCSSGRRMDETRGWSAQTRQPPTVRDVTRHRHIIDLYTVSQKGEQNVFCNIFYKTQAILITDGTLFPK